MCDCRNFFIRFRQDRHTSDFGPNYASLTMVGNPNRRLNFGEPKKCPVGVEKREGEVCGVRTVAL